MQADSAAVEEVPVWLEVNGAPAVTWMCTPDQLEELATGWLHGEGYIETLDDLLKLRPCAPDLGFWADVRPERVAAVRAEDLVNAWAYARSHREEIEDQIRANEEV